LTSFGGPISVPVFAIFAFSSLQDLAQGNDATQHAEVREVFQSAVVCLVAISSNLLPTRIGYIKGTIAGNPIFAVTRFPVKIFPSTNPRIAIIILRNAIRIFQP
jgi:hypothetical protein